MVTAIHDGRRRVLAGVNRAAAALDLRPGLPLAQARAMVPGLLVMEADPDGDRAALVRLAAWCLHLTPLTSADPPDGVWL
jgi:protein ImuB